MLERSLKHCHFLRRTFWQNGTFSVRSCAMTIDIFKFENNGNLCGLLQELQLIL